MRGVDTFLGLKEQVDLFTPRTAAQLVSGDFLAFNSESLSGRQQVISSPAIRQRAMRAIAYSANGTIAAEGSVEFTASNFVMDKLLSLIFHSKTGVANTVDGSGAVYTLVSGGELTPFTAFVGFDGPEGVYTRRFTGAKVNRTTLSARVDSMLTVSCDVAAINKEILVGGDAVATPVYPGALDEYAYIFSDASVLFKAGDMADLGEIPVESFDITINHNLATDKYRLGSLYRRSLQESVTDVEGSFTLDAAAQALAGEALNTEGGGTNDPAFFERIAREGAYAALRFTVIDENHLVGTTPSGMTIELPFVRLEEPDFNVRDAGLITGSARFTAYDEITVTHVCELAGTAAVVDEFTGMTLNPDEASVAIAGEVVLTPLFTGVTGNPDFSVTWATDDAGIATVVAGTVTGVAEGTAIITATSVADGTITATATITVTA